MKDGIPQNHLALLRAHFDAPNHTATWAQLAAAVGYEGGIAVNLQYGTLAGRVAQAMGIKAVPNGFWLDVLAGWAKERDAASGHTAFVLRRPVIDALQRLGILPGGASAATGDASASGDTTNEGSRDKASADDTGTASRWGAGFGDAAENKLVESAAVDEVTRQYEGDGWTVRTVERERCGFDLECTKNGVVENVEVKGISGAEPNFIITAGEVRQARTNSNFFLFVVTSALSATPQLTKFNGADFFQRYDLSPIQFRAVCRS